MEDKPKRKRIRLKNFDYSSLRPYFITICSKEKEPIFTNDKLNNVIIKCILEEKRTAGFNIFVFCLMPNHLHLLLAPAEKGMSVSRFIGGFKSKTTKLSWSVGIYGKLWQDRFYDRILRKREDLKTIGQYILDNPVRKGLVSKWQDYKYLGILDSWV